MLAIDLPGPDDRRRLSALTRIALRAALTALPLQPGDASLAARGNKLPTRTGAGPRRIPKCDPGATIVGDEVVLMILGGFIECAADFHALAVAAASRQANPV